MRAREFLTKETAGRIFSVYFLKGDGQPRNMICRLGVKKGLVGGDLPYDARKKGILPVFEIGPGSNHRRSFRFDRLVSFNIGGETFIVE